MRAVGALIEELCAETRTGWSWMLMLSQVEAPGWIEFHGPKGWRGDPAPTSAGPSRIELWPTGGASTPLIALPLAANQDPGRHFHALCQRALDPNPGWLVLLGLLHALDEASRARPRIATVGDGVTAAGVTTLGGWASALTLADLQSALLRTHD